MNELMNPSINRLIHQSITQSTNKTKNAFQLKANAQIFSTKIGSPPFKPYPYPPNLTLTLKTLPFPLNPYPYPSQAIHGTASLHYFLGGMCVNQEQA